MSGKNALGCLILAFGLSLLTACGNVGSAGPQPAGKVNGNQVHQMCNVPQIPACLK
jgi:hypothetical protein